MGQSGGIIQSLYLSEKGEREAKREQERERWGGGVLPIVCRCLCNSCAGPAIFTLHLSFTAIDPHEESVEDLMQRFQDSFRAPSTPSEISRFEHVMHSSLTGRRRVPTHTRGEPRTRQRRVCFKEFHLPGTIEIFYNRDVTGRKCV